MKLKLTVILAAGVVALGLLLSASTAQAAPKVIFFENNATGIQNLEVDGKLYDVKFVFDSAENIYGETLIFDFQEDGIDAARRAVIDALNNEPAVRTVGPEKDSWCHYGLKAIGSVPYVAVAHDLHTWPTGPWKQDNGISWLYTDSVFTYADFTEVSGPGPPPVIGDAPVPKTGQTESVSEGDDGDLQKGVAWPEPRFIDNGDGTVTDHLTGLIWVLAPNRCGALPGESMMWEDALTYISTVADGLCGLDDGSLPGDWRLPNVRELLSLIDYGMQDPALPQDAPFDGIGNGGSYWSSTRPGPTPAQASIAIAVDMGNGIAIMSPPSTAMALWPVRGGND